MLLPGEALALALQGWQGSQVRPVALRMYEVGAQGQNCVMGQSGNRLGPRAGPQVHGSSRWLSEFAGVSLHLPYIGKPPDFLASVTHCWVLSGP